MGYNPRGILIGATLAVAGGESPLGYNAEIERLRDELAVAGGESPLGYNPAEVVDRRREL